MQNKRHSVLQDLFTDLSKGNITDTFEVFGRKFTMHTLNEDEETWADTFIRTNTTAALISSRRAPRLAASISAIDNIPVSELFQYPDDMPMDLRKEIESNPIQKAFWIREQLLKYLNEVGNRSFIIDLYSKYEELIDRREAGLKEIPKS
jgi:hypothetical protein